MLAPARGGTGILWAAAAAVFVAAAIHTPFGSPFAGLVPDAILYAARLRRPVAAAIVVAAAILPAALAATILPAALVVAAAILPAGLQTVALLPAAILLPAILLTAILP